MFACTRQDGICFAFPDTCKTPTPGGPVPVPYPNMGQMPQAKGNTVSKVVFVTNKPVLTTQSVIAQTVGDEPGSIGGVVSGKIKGEAKFTKGSAKVYVEGSPLVFLSCATAQNGNNANAPMGHVITPSQTIVLVGS